MISPSIFRTFWKIPCVAGCVGPRLRMDNSFSSSPSCLFCSTGAFAFFFETVSSTVSVAAVFLFPFFVIIVQTFYRFYLLLSDLLMDILFLVGKYPFHPHLKYALS